MVDGGIKGKKYSRRLRRELVLVVVVVVDSGEMLPGATCAASPPSPLTPPPLLLHFPSLLFFSKLLLPILLPLPPLFLPFLPRCPLSQGLIFVCHCQCLHWKYLPECNQCRLLGESQQQAA